jgi:GT2 family glycosyltransferase
MDISFILLTWNSERYIKKCLESLLESLSSLSYMTEIFVVENGSTDNTGSLLKIFQSNHPEQIFPIYLKKNTGTTYSRNLALKKAKGRYICIMDSDIEVSSEVFPTLLHTLRENEKIGLAAPRLVYPNGRLQKSTDVFPTIFTKFFRYLFLKAIEQREHNATISAERQNAVREVDYAIAAMWLLKQEVAQQVGLLDEHIFYAPEDVDYCLRIWQAGYSIVYNPTVSCIHHTQEISRGFRINKAMLSHIQGLAYYFKKHRYLFSRPKFKRSSNMTNTTNT